MSLNFNIGNIPNWKEVTLNPDGRLSHVTEALALRSMSVDLGSITKENLAEWMFRLHCVSRVFGKPFTHLVQICTLCRAVLKERKCPTKECQHTEADVREEIVGVDFTIAQVRLHIGLTTNADTKTRAGFLRNIAKRMKADVERWVIDQFRKEKEEAV